MDVVMTEKTFMLSCVTILGFITRIILHKA